MSVRNTGLDAEQMEEALRQSLARVYDGRIDSVLSCLRTIGRRYYLRLSGEPDARQATVTSMRGRGFEVSADESIEEAAFLPVKEGTPQAEGVQVCADRYAAEAVMLGAHLYAPGVKDCKGLRAGVNAFVKDREGILVGSGFARQGETSILRFRQGVAVETLESRFRLPALRETSWYKDGLIHLQSLPAMVACHVLDPKPGETVIDLNCSPAGKMSHLCQLTNNKATVVGFDRNERKIEKARGHLERLHCKNYRLIAHDSRYADVDYTLRADKVLVDPPCTGLGIMPRLAIDVSMENVRNAASYQKQFLRSAKGIVKKGGTIVYSVCTITPEECESAVEFGENELGLKEVPSDPTVQNELTGSSGLSRRFDPEHDGAGFFIAKFIKQ